MMQSSANNVSIATPTADSISANVATYSSVKNGFTANDSIANDSVATAISYGLVIRPEYPPLKELPARSTSHSSWVILLLFALFALSCLRLSKSRKYLRVLINDLTEVKARHNAFDDTVRETSLLVLLNFFWSASAGVLLNMNISGTTNLSDTAICIGIMLLYNIFMAGAYLLFGNIFTDSIHARMWMKGFAAAQGLSTFIFFPAAIGAICYPQSLPQMTIAAIVTFIISKIVFICKGFRIFFTQLSSWVLFLYYLCSLEIVPLILTYFLASVSCTK